MATEVIASSSHGTHHFDLALFPQQPSARGWSRGQIHSHIQRHPWLASFDGAHLVAFILYIQIKGVIEVSYLETRPPYRRQGCMESLLLRLFELSPIVWLDVHCENQPAIHLYKKLGFKNQGLRKGYYRDGGDCLLLEKKRA